MSSPHVLRSLGGRVRPFNFLLSPLVAPFGYPEGADPEQFRLVAPWEPDPDRWLYLRWVDVHSGDSYRITTSDDLGATGAVLVLTYRDVLARHERHPEPKSVGEEGSLIGLLARRHLESLEPPELIGKEGASFERFEMGMPASAVGQVIRYGDMQISVWRDLVLPALRDASLRWIEQQTGLSRRTIQRARNGHTLPHARARGSLSRLAVSFARHSLSLREGSTPPSTDLGVLARYLRLRHGG